MDCEIRKTAAREKRSEKGAQQQQRRRKVGESFSGLSEKRTAGTFEGERKRKARV